MTTLDGRSTEQPPFWLTPPAYWLPGRFPLSAWFTHAPFAAWLVDVVRPRRIVELGTHFGFSAFAFAEAAKRLALPTTVSALDSWEGDDHAGFYDGSVYDSVASIRDEDYRDSVELVRGWFTDSRPLFADASIDILHIDGRHAYEDALADYTEWCSVVRDGGVILFHDIAERDKGFGVWRLWDELAVPGRSFAFQHGHGLGVLPVGERWAEPLHRLCGADRATADRIRADFSRLGDGVHRQAYLESLPQELEDARALSHQRALLVNELTNVSATRQDRIEALTSSTSWKVTAPLRALGRLRSSR